MRIIILAVFLVCLSACKKDKQKDREKDDTNGFISKQTYTKTVIEVVYLSDWRPTDQALSELKTFLERLLDKPDGIELQKRASGHSAKAVYSFADLQAIEKEERLIGNEGSTNTAWIFFAPGEYDQNTSGSKVLGIAYGGSSIVLFEKTIRDLSGGLAQPSTAMTESAVLRHEFGHLMGLVNNGTPMVGSHQDEAHGKHCNNSACLMYWATETSDLVKNLLNMGAPEFDENCLSDVRANGGR